MKDIIHTRNNLILLSSNKISLFHGVKNAWIAIMLLLLATSLELNFFSPKLYILSVYSHFTFYAMLIYSYHILANVILAIDLRFTKFSTIYTVHFIIHYVTIVIIFFWILDEMCLLFTFFVYIRKKILS